jgi:ribosomal protein L11 methyltransferase
VLELTLRVAAADLEEVLDAVLPALPGGVHLSDEGEVVAIAVAARAGIPDERQLRRLAGRRLIDLRAAEVSDDWRERRVARHRPLVVAERFLLRPDWAPAARDAGLVEIVLEPSGAFGTGAHPTTQACLSLLAAIEPGGSFVDCGCGSGVLSIGAAKLGWSPVWAIDVDEASVAAARRNAARNEVEVEARRVDVTSEPVPAAATVAANVPPAIHPALVEGLATAPERAVVSGFKPAEAEAVAAAWEAHGLAVAERLQASEWTALLLLR